MFSDQWPAGKVTTGGTAGNRLPEFSFKKTLGHTLLLLTTGAHCVTIYDICHLFLSFFIKDVWFFFSVKSICLV